MTTVYLEKQSLYREKPVTHMDDDTLEAYVRHYIAASETQNEVAFTWQGGEPTLLGLDFYRRAVALQAKYGAGRKISNSFQTNGVLLDDEWCAFLAENHFLVGLSLDGPAEIHNQYRVTKGGRPTHKLVMRALTLLQKHHVDYNVLVCVNRTSALQPCKSMIFCVMQVLSSSSLFRWSSAWLMKRLLMLDLSYMLPAIFRAN